MMIVGWLLWLFGVVLGAIGGALITLTLLGEILPFYGLAAIPSIILGYYISMHGNVLIRRAKT
jgi:hypothetical protein